MKYIEFRHLVKNPIFTPQDLALLGATYTPSQMTVWQRKGYITKLRGQLYAFTDSLKGTAPEVISSYLHSPSYLSLEYALSHYGIIPEAVYSYTAVTSKTTRSYTLPQGHFVYRHLPPQLFFGYQIVSTSILPYNLAEPEKALLDYLYLTPNIRNSKDLYELRLNLEPLQMSRLHEYLSHFDSRRLDYLVRIMDNMHAHH